MKLELVSLELGLYIKLIHYPFSLFQLKIKFSFTVILFVLSDSYKEMDWYFVFCCLSVVYGFFCK